MASFVRQIKQDALELGFDAVGVAPAQPGQHLREYLEWLSRGYHGGQSYLARPDRVARRRDLQLIMPGVRSMIVVALHYWPGPPPATATLPGRGRISSYAIGEDYHRVMLPRLERLHTLMRAHTGRVTHGRAYVDTGPLLERDHAFQAGLGFIGKNTNLIRPSAGSWLFLGELLTEQELEPDEPAHTPGCGSCRRCREACPTGALVEPFVLDARRCISYLTTALKGTIPRESRSLVGNHIYGCDVCQAVCPWNRFAVPIAQAPNQDPPYLLDLLAASPAEFRSRYGHTPIGHIGYERFLRNVAVAVGNWAAPEAGPPLARLLQSPSSLVRTHAVWALGRLGTLQSRAALSDALPDEPDAAVRDEITHSLTEEL